VQQHPETGREETEEERLDRNLVELLGELRVALPGVQVLFAFLLVVPFNPAFTRVTPFQEKTYYATLLLSAGASACLIAPSIHHRITFRRQDKGFLIEISNRMMIVGMTLLALAMTGAVMLVTDVLFGTALTAIATGLVAALFALLWYVVPLRRRTQLDG